MRVSTSEGPCIFVAGREEEIGSHRQMSRSIKLPSLPARAGLRTQANLALTQRSGWGGSGEMGWEQVRKSYTTVGTGSQNPYAQASPGYFPATCVQVFPVISSDYNLHIFFYYSRS